MSNKKPGRFTASAMTAAMRQVADRIGAPSSDAQLIRLTNNAVFALPAAGLVIRITRSHELLDRATKVAHLGAWFDHVDAPTIRLAPPVEQPVHVDGLAATIWQHLPTTPPAPTVEDLGGVLRHFHHLGMPPFGLPPWDPIGDARRRLADAECLTDQHRTLLLQRCAELEPAVAALNARAVGGLIHGDAHVGNLLRTPAGRVVLCDFDATCTGPWQVDLAAVAVGEVRFSRAGAHARLAAAYGHDITTDPDWTVLRDARELKMVAAAVPLLRSTPGITAEFTTRLNSVIDRDRHARWTPFADLPAPS